ncbi:hypothetical protein ACHAW6_011791 [Cyclotella cf. meneghiniana]
MDLSNFYLMTPLKQPKYIHVQLTDLPNKIIKEYKLYDKTNSKGMVFLEVTKVIYGLSQAGLLMNKLLEQCLNKHGYVQSKLIPGLGNTYPNQSNSPSALSTLAGNMLVANMPYTCSVSSKNITSSTGTIQNIKSPPHAGVCQKGPPPIPTQTQQATTPAIPTHTAIKYGATTQYTKTPSTSPRVDAKTKEFIQQVCGIFLFLGCAVDSTLLTPISRIASQSAEPTKDTLN